MILSDFVLISAGTLDTWLPPNPNDPDTGEEGASRVFKRTVLLGGFDQRGDK